MDVIIIGSTGLVGTHLLEKLAADKIIKTIYSISRAPLQMTHPKIKEIIIDFEKLGTWDCPKVDVAFCCLGTTLKAAGSKEKFKRVDFDYINYFASACLKAKVNTFILVSSIGANSQSRNFYLKVKGMIEDKLNTFSFSNLVILRPGLLLGSRKQTRPLEALVQKTLPFISPFMFGPLRNLRPVSANIVAERMRLEAIAVFNKNLGVKIIFNKSIVQ